MRRREEAGGGGGGADTELKTKTPHVNVGKKHPERGCFKGGLKREIKGGLQGGA